MKTFLKLLLTASLLVGCGAQNDSAPASDADSGRVENPPDSVLSGESGDGARAGEPVDEATENSRLAMANLLTAKKEISELRNELRDSLAQSGLTQDQRLLFSQTIRELDLSARQVNRQLEQIVVADLQSSRGKLAGIIQQMKASEKELAGMIERLGRITSYIQTATTLLQAIVHVPAPRPPSR